MEWLVVEEKWMKIVMKERITIKHLQQEQKKLETEEKIVIIKERGKLIAKLPKLDLKKFDGNILKWTRFWDAFEATIHNNKNLHNINKFKLRGQIKGTAGELLFELKLTKGSYEVAVNILKERYGKKHNMIVAHFDKMMNLPITTYISEIILRHQWETFTLFMLAWRRWQSNADHVDVEIQTAKEYVTSVG